MLALVLLLCRENSLVEFCQIGGLFGVQTKNGKGESQKGKIKQGRIRGITLNTPHFPPTLGLYKVQCLKSGGLLALQDFWVPVPHLVHAFYQQISFLNCFPCLMASIYLLFAKLLECENLCLNRIQIRANYCKSAVQISFQFLLSSKTQRQFNLGHLIQFST